MIDYSIIIPAYNEEEFLPATLEAAVKVMNAVKLHGEIIVVDNNSADRTAEIARSYGTTVIFEPCNQISRARNRGAEAAQGKYLIFLDADTLVTEELFKRTFDNLINRNYCGGGVTLIFDAPQDIFITGFVNLWNYVSVKMSLATGSYFYVLKECFDAVGGFSEKVYASEEIWLSKKCIRWGKKIIKFLRSSTTLSLSPPDGKRKDFRPSVFMPLCSFS
ncbi:MAG: glycosyltransferase [Victivallaceae bacterium]|nr:glycosyltransferase [Victivallaceae bacterium]